MTASHKAIVSKNMKAYWRRRRKEQKAEKISGELLTIDRIIKDFGALPKPARQYVRAKIYRVA